MTQTISPSAPFVGMRPFQRGEKLILCGRDRDARMLCDKIFSSRLTLLYAGSGIGKSSLLNALVIPQLEDEESWVFYFDAWSSEHPLEVLKSHLITAAVDAGIPSAGDGAPSLTELTRLLAAIDGRTLVLIFDQFEELLTNHGQDLEPIKAELASLVRMPGLDLRVVLSMREEFLAAMEPFRGDITDLFQVTFRLKPLDEKGALAAVMEPPQQFGGSCEPAFAQRIAADLLQLDEALGEAGASHPIPLPMLQLVCDELWKRSTDKQLTLKAYQAIGGSSGIISHYVAGVMPRHWTAKTRTARLLLHLAPPSGFKSSYATEDLAVETGLQQALIEQELERLSQAGLLRSRKWRQATRYELQHDALIGILSPWRDRVLARARGVKRVQWFTAAAVVAALFIGSLAYLYHWQQARELHANTEGLLSAPIPTARSGKYRMDGEDVGAILDISRLQAARLNAATSYVLNRQDSYDYLKALLQKYKDLQPQGYGVEAGRELITLPAGDWPLKLRYSSRRKLDQLAFNLTWQSMANSFAESWNIPVPKRIALKEDKTYQLQAMTLEGPDIASLTLSAPTYESEVYINEMGLVGHARDFFVQFPDAWTKVEQIERGGPWWVVPRWSLPVWNVAASGANDGSGLPAFLLALELLKQPDRLVTKPAVELLLQRTGKLYPSTVAEARAARGDRLINDLVERVRLERALTQLPLILDDLALYPEEDPATLAETVDFALNSRPVPLPERLHGPWVREAVTETVGTLSQTTGPETDESGLAKITDPYREAEAWLPEVEHKIRGYVGSELQQQWFPVYELTPGLKEAFKDVRDDLYRRFGVVIPWVRFHDDTWLPGLDPRAFTLTLLNQSATDEAPILSEPDQALERFSEALAFRAQAYRTEWIDADFVNRQLDALKPALRDWLYQRYSLTDLKILLRSVIYPSLEERDRYPLAADDERFHPPPQNSIRNLPWLLGSLVFWTRFEDPLDGAALSQRLRETQRARLEAAEPSPPGTGLDERLGNGLADLAAGRIETAEQAFATAVRKDRAKAVATFLTLYPAELERQHAVAIEEQCRVPKSASLSQELRTYLEDRLDDTASSSWDRQSLQHALCLFHAYSLDERPARREVLIEHLLAGFASQQPLDADAAADFAVEVLSAQDPIGGNLEILTQAQALLTRAIVALDEAKALNAFLQTLSICQRPKPNNWCWQTLKSLAERKPTLDIELELALQLSQQQRKEDLHKGLELARRCEQKVRLDKEKPVKNHEAILLSQALAKMNLAWLGDDAALSLSESKLKELLDSQTFGSDAMELLIKILLFRDRLTEARKLVEENSEHRISDIAHYRSRLYVNLMVGDIQRAREVANEVLVKIQDKEHKHEALFVASMGQILTNAPQAEHTARLFLDTDHKYIGFVTMMLYTFMSGGAHDEADELLQERWGRINPASWERRLAGGDTSVWQEMLLGRFRGEVPESRIFDPLQDEAHFAASELANLPFARQALQCEAYFYDAMLAKAHHNRKRMLDSLRKSVASGYGSYYEYTFAKFLLARESGQ